MVQYPLEFKVRAGGPAGINQIWTAESPAHAGPVKVAIPPEFEGPGGGYSPEDLYALALENCFVATFKVFAEKSRLAYAGIDVDGTLTVDRDAEGKPWMAAFALAVRLNGVEKADAATRLLERAAQNCLILNSVRTKTTFTFDVTGNATGVAAATGEAASSEAASSESTSPETGRSW